MTSYRAGDVVLIPFPFTDLSTVKQRPAVVLSSSHFNRRRNDVIIAAITSHLPKKIATDEYLLTATEQHRAGLPKPSMVKLGKIVTLEQRLVRKRLGRIPETGRRRLVTILIPIFRGT